MKILYFDVDALGTPYSGGQSRRTFEVARRLARKHEVTVVTAGYKGLCEETIDGVQYRRMLPFPVPANMLWYFCEILPRGVLSDADLVVESFSTPFTASLLHYFTAKPVIGTASFLFSAEMAQKYHLPFDRWERFVMRGYRYVVALSDAQKRHVSRIAPRAMVEVIPNGADERARTFQWSGSGGYLAYLGRIDFDQKGLGYLLDAMEGISQSVECRIAGNGRDVPRLFNEIGKRGLGHAVKYVGALSGDERHRFLAEAGGMAFPSRYEGQSLVLLDAVTIGVPVVAFDIEANKEVLEGCAPLSPAFDVPHFRNAIVNVLGDRAFAKALSDAERAASVRYRWENTAALEETFYLRVMESRFASSAP